MRNQEIYTMGLHDVISDDCGMNIIRVAGGWIYEFTYDGEFSHVFVPFNNEFEAPEPEQKVNY